MVFRLISRHLALLTLLAAVAAYLHPPAFRFLGGGFLALFAATMFCLGLVLHPDEARDAWTRPGRIGLGVATQFVVMPLLAFAAALLVEGAGGAPALAHFEAEAALPGALFAVWCILTAAGATAYLRRRRHAAVA